MKWDVGEKTEMMVESDRSEGEVFESWFTAIKPCFIKNSKHIFLQFISYFYLVLFDCNTFFKV